MINTEPAAGSDVSPGLWRTMTAASDIDGLPRQREIEVEGSAFAGAALHSNFPSVLLNDAVGYGQAQPGASRLPFTGRRLGGEEWVVNPVDMLLRNAAAGIRDHHARASPILSGVAQRPAIAHRIFGIQKQVQEHLLQPPRIPV